MGYVTVGSIDDYYKKALAASKTQLDSTIANINSSAEQQKQSVQGIYDKNINDTNAAYEDSYRENAVQKLINEREVAENMANLGLTNSGLNRTQQTAVQLSYANNKANIDRQKQAQVDSLAQSLAAELANIETTRLSSVADVTNQNSQAAMQSAYELRNAEVENNASVYKAEIEAAQKADTNISKLNYGTLASSAFDSNGNVIYRDLSGNSVSMRAGANPYTGKVHKDALDEYGKFDSRKVFSNGYQPNNYNGKPLSKYKSEKGEPETFVPAWRTDGKPQSIWEAGGKKYVWDGTEGRYYEVVYDKAKGWIFA